MKKALFVVTTVVGFGLISLLIYFTAFFELLPVERTVIATAAVEQRPYRLEAVYVGAGATSLDGLEVQRVWRDGRKKLVGQVEVHDRLERVEVSEQGSMVEVVLHFRARVDTLLFE